MKKTAAILTIFALSASPVFAAKQGGFVAPESSVSTQQSRTQQGGFNGPSGTRTTVAKAKELSDDAWVTLTGKIEQRIGGDHYLFRDSTGTVDVDIDHKRWNGQTITPEDTVEIEGEIDKDWNSVEIDVKRIRKVS